MDGCPHALAAVRIQQAGIGGFSDLTTRICLASSETVHHRRFVSCCGIFGGGIWRHLGQLRLTNPLGRSAGPGRANSGKATPPMHSLAPMPSHWTRASNTEGWGILNPPKKLRLRTHSWAEDLDLDMYKTQPLECLWNAAGMLLEIPDLPVASLEPGGWPNSQIRGTVWLMHWCVCLHCESCSCFKPQQTNERL